jgi:D-xylose transport system substrate-binding protein
MRKTVTKIVMSMAVVGGLAFAVAPGTSSAKTVIPPVTIHSFKPDFSFMAKLAGLTAEGKGKVAVILPDTVTSQRYVEFDAPLLTRAFKDAKLPASDLTVQNAQGNDATQITDAQTAISNGASVILIDPLDSVTGAQVEKLAKQAGVVAIDYDRLTLGGSRKYYVSFNNVKVGETIGKGLVKCVAGWKVAHPRVIVGYGATTDNNATLFGQGYNSVLNPLFASGKWKLIHRLAGTWTPSQALTEFQGAYAASHHQANALLSPNDSNAAPIITYLKQTYHLKPYRFPTTGQDATILGLQNIISGYQCGTVYKPIFEEAQAAATLALFARANLKPPSAFVNTTTSDGKVKVPSVLLEPEWVVAKTIESTVVADHAVSAKDICAGYAADCKRYGIH